MVHKTKLKTLTGLLPGVLLVAGCQGAHTPAPNGAPSPCRDASGYVAQVNDPAPESTRFSHTISITGFVRRASDSTPLPSVQVFLVGPGIGTMTDRNGRYLLLNVPDTVPLDLGFQIADFNVERIDVTPDAMVVQVDASLVGPCPPPLTQ